jgi:hypothetical protein
VILVLWDVVLFITLLFGLPQNDFCRMYYATRAYWQGEDMYGWNPATPARLDDETAVDLWNMNPPHFHLALLPLGPLPREMALAGWWLVSFLCLSACLRWIIRETGLELTSRTRQLGLLALLGFTGTGAMILTSQLSFLLLVPVTRSWIEALRGNWRLSGLWLGVALSVKPFLLLVVPYLLLKRRWAAVLACGAATAACFGVGLTVFGLANHVSWYRGLGVAVTWSWLPLNAALAGMLSRTFSESASFTPVALLAAESIRALTLALSALIGALTLGMAARDHSPQEVDRSFALLLVVAVLLCPLGWTYYYWLPLGPVLALRVWKRDGAEGRTGLWGHRLFWLVFPGLF